MKWRFALGVLLFNLALLSTASCSGPIYGDGWIDHSRLTMSGSIGSDSSESLHNASDAKALENRKSIIAPPDKFDIVIPLEEWNKTFGGVNDEIGRSVQETKHGGYIVAGDRFYGNCAGNVCPSDIWLIKTESTGDELWNKTFGGPNYESGRSVQETNDGGFVITGPTNSLGSGYSDAWLIKTDSAGNELWNKTFGGSNPDGSESVRETSDGGYIIVGRTDSFGAAEGDAWLIKTDSAGNELWNKTFGGSESVESGVCVQETSAGGYVIAGHSYSSETENGDVLLIKTDSAGNELWNKTFGGANFDYGYSVQETIDDGYIIAGPTNSYGAGGSDVWLIRTDSTGNELWNKTFGGPLSDESYSVQETSDGGFIVVGFTNSFGTVSNIWLIKTDSTGNESWNKTFDENSWGWSVQETSDSGYIITGHIYSFGSGRDVLLIKVAGPTPDQIGVFRNGGWYFDANGDGYWSTNDTISWFGTTDDLPAAGDWDGNGKDEIAVFRNGGWYFDANGDGYWSTNDTIGWFGTTGDIPVAGDWDGNGKDEIAVFRNGGLYSDANGDGYWSTNDTIGWFGTTGDLPVAGDWDGNGKDEIAVFRNGGWYFDANGDGYWTSGDTTGWFGATGDLPVAGDWDGNGKDEIAVFRNGGWYFDMNGDGYWTSGDTTGWFGAAGDKPFAVQGNVDWLPCV